MKKILTLTFSLIMASSAWADGFSGEWTLTIDTPRGVTNPTMVVNKDGDTYSGVYNSLRGPLPIDDITVNGNSFAFPLVITVPIGDITVQYTGTFDGDTMTGNVENPRGVVPFTGKKSG